ncbi:NAD(P)H-hydrate epimerase [Microbacterium candidum]|uniref:NAD(P)H-hydrate epimerase n=1 Tax=Microbacterium candidum TaxID=3041922 RepID=A0ABT7N3D3_9MICO|nr:NAD(P)H-hydrate epimerase [Microbacterium sp. ASV49]MDL9981214.1 NAD(P)H-hydrate epimerase [Microbacterium sp. ASV49]
MTVKSVVPTYTAAQVRAAEAPLLAAGVPLMKRAAAALAAVVAEHGPQTILVLAGAGDNGGDALFAAAALATQGIRVDLLRTADRVHDEAWTAALAAGAHEIVEPASSYGLVVDGILGIGARGALRGRAREIVTLLLPLHPRVVAVDLPSGLDADDGASDGVVLPAETTVTFGAMKRGLAARVDLAGRVILVDLGLELTDPVGSAAVAEVRVG